MGEKMRHRIRLGILIAAVIFLCIGCKTKALPTSFVGIWDLETISNMDGEILLVGKAYGSYENCANRKEEMQASFNADGTFQIESSGESLQGEYIKDNKKSTTDAIAINMNIDNESEIFAVYGIRQYEDGEEIDSLTFTLDDKIYSFTKPLTK